MRVMSAGEGYRYLLRSVATGDGDRSLSTLLTRYYAEAGTPPGAWTGSGLTGLGERRMEVGSEVTEAQLALLMGQGRHPVTGEPLGRALVAPERDVARRGEESGRRARRAVAGYDLTFSVPKSVSALWAVADAGTQVLIASAHHAATREVLALLEREVAATRVGAQGVAQVDVPGVVAAAFDHYDSRAGDPQLHTHVVVSTKVQGPDGRWRSLDGRPLHAAVVALSEHYNAVLADHLTRDLGVGWDARVRGRDRNPIWEITSVPEELIGHFSSRSAAIEAEKERLIAQYVGEHGRQPSARAVIRLRQQATLATRPAKELHSLADLTAEWRERATSVLGQEATTWASYITSNNPRPMLLRADDLTADEIRDMAAVVVTQVGEKRSTWRRWNLHAEASRQLAGARFATTADREAVVGAVVRSAEDASLRLTPPEPVTAPAAFTRADGTSAFRPKHHTVFSSTALLAAEDRLMELAGVTTAPQVPLVVVEKMLRRPVGTGVRLDGEQRRAVETIAASARVVDVLVGPAGSGKTTTLAGLRRAWEHQHGPGSVIGLAPSASAAEVLAADLGIGCENTAKWRHEHRRGRWDLRSGQLVILDEASLAGTLMLHELAEHAAAVGAKLVLVGDWAQLTAVDAGGVFGMLARDRREAPQLSEVRRFAHEWEKTASLSLRMGNVAVIGTYEQQGRLRDGTLEDMLDGAYTAWQADTGQELRSLLIAETREMVTELNTRARDDLILAGVVSAEGARLHDGNLAGTGDLVITRRNDRRISTGRGWVKNGDTWRVTRHHEDGSLTVKRADSRFARSIVLPATYVAQDVDLG